MDSFLFTLCFFHIPRLILNSLSLVSDAINLLDSLLVLFWKSTSNIFFQKNVLEGKLCECFQVKKRQPHPYHQIDSSVGYRSLGPNIPFTSGL